MDPNEEVAAIRAGTVDFLAPAYLAGIEEALAGPDVEVVRNASRDLEALAFQVLNGPFADPVFREAFWMSIDVDSLFAAVYEPLAVDRSPPTCEPIAQDPYCPDDVFEDTYDPEGAAALLAENGWVKDASGFWSKDGVAPEINWMVTTGNGRREATQDYLIPLLARAGFNVVRDNCVAECVFDQRLPALDYDLALFATSAPPDPGYLTAAFACANVPSPRNDFRGQNQQGWCNREASTLLERADTTIDDEERAALVQDAIRLMEDDHVLLPVFRVPRIGAYRTDRIGGEVEAELNNDRAFGNIHDWTDADGDGRIVIGAEQWPLCLNPVTECAFLSWYRWTVMFPLLPAVWDTTEDGRYEPTELVVGEPEVVVASPAASSTATVPTGTEGG